MTKLNAVLLNLLILSSCGSPEIPSNSDNSNGNTNRKNNSTLIQGKLISNEYYGKRLYLSLIDELDGLKKNYISDAIAYVDLDSAGEFKFENLPLSSDNQFYKLHVSPKEEFGYYIYDPLIEAKGHNFINFIGQSGDTITVNSSSEKLFDSLTSSNAKAKTWINVDNLRIKWFHKQPSHQNLTYHTLLKGFSEELMELTENLSFIEKLAIYEELQFVQNCDENYEINNTEQEFLTNYREDFIEKIKGGVDSNKNQRVSISKWNHTINYGVLITIIILLGGIVFMQNKKLKQVKVPELSSKSILSKQEDKVYDLLKQKKSNQEIADALYISVSTVKTHSSSIYKKLNIKGRKSIST